MIVKWRAAYFPLLIMAVWPLFSAAQPAPTGSGQAASTGSGQAYPAKSVRIVASFPPGTGVDIAARIVALKLGESMGQQFVVDNRSGAGGRTRAVNRVPACGM